ncbi:MAG: hypothetical protein ABI042_17080, partial [Verrucomicrobiota bacterium]
ELQPLVLSYKSNLVTQLETLPPVNKGRLRSAKFQVDRLEAQVNSVLKPMALKTNSLVRQTQARPTNAPRATILSTAPPEPKFEPTTNAFVVNRFVKIPFERLTTNGVKIFSHRYSEEKLLLDFRFEHMDEFYNRTPVAGAAIWDPKNETTEFVVYPPAESYRGYVGSMFEEAESGLYAELHQGALYFADWAKIWKYDFKTRLWQKLPIPVQTLAQLFTVDGRLFAATGESIIELLDGGQGSRILASTRRRPSASLLDSFENLGKPVLFAGPNGSLRTYVGKNVYAWNGQNWSVGTEIPGSGATRIFADGVLFQMESFRQSSQVWVFSKDQTNAELCLAEAYWEPGFSGAHSFNPTISGSAKSLRPTWNDMQNISVVGRPATIVNSNLYFYLDHATPTNDLSGHQTFIEKDGRHANLVYLDHEFSKPTVVPLKFNSSRGPVPNSVTMKGGSGLPWFAPTWIFFARENLFIGQSGTGGFWLVPLREIEAAFAPQKQIQRHGNLEKAATAEKRKRALLAKYDANHDGKFSRAEKDKMWDDPDGLEELWLEVDTNKNGFLDGEDNLTAFDVNENGICEPRELALFVKIQAIAARDLISHFDADHDGFLSGQEIEHISTHEAESSSVRRFYFNALNWNGFDADHDGKLSRIELKQMLQKRTMDSIFATQPDRMEIRRLMHGAMGRQMSDSEGARIENAFKLAVEELWRKKKVNNPVVK